MSKLCKFATRLAAASVMALVSAGTSFADPGLGNVAPHQHLLVTPNDDAMPVGPNICENPDLQQAFNQFHYNVHHSGIRVDGEFVPIETLGPQDGAPGLHDGLGADLGVRGC